MATGDSEEGKQCDTSLTCDFPQPQLSTHPQSEPGYPEASKPPQSPHNNPPQSPPDKPLRSPPNNPPQSPPDKPLQSELGTPPESATDKRQSHSSSSQPFPGVKNTAARKLSAANRRRCMKKSTKEPVEVIDIEEYKPKTKSKETYWLQNTCPKLKEEDRVIIESGRWLTDDIINASQAILKQQFQHLGSSGLQDVTCGISMNFNIEASKFILIIHVPSRSTGY